MSGLMTVGQLKKYRNNKINELQKKEQDRIAKRDAFQESISPLLRQFVETMKELGVDYHRYIIRVNNQDLVVREGCLFKLKYLSSGANSDNELAEETPILADGHHLISALNAALKDVIMKGVELDESGC